MSNPAMPAVFLGHGSPMNALEINRFTEVWASIGKRARRPRGVFAISAHWYVNFSAVTAMRAPRVIHDFYGFPQALFDFDYPAPGSPELADEVAEIAKPVLIGQDVDSWGLDHGTWSVLAHVFPHADVPVVQLAIDASKPIEYHVDLGARLAGLLSDDVMIVTSGNVVHNLRLLDWSRATGGFDWAERFDAATSELLEQRPEDFAALREHPDFDLSVPTSDHFLPLAYLAGISLATGEACSRPVRRCVMDALSMTSHMVGTIERDR